MAGPPRTGTLAWRATQQMVRDLLNLIRRSSKDTIYESIMRGGGEPFGAPYEFGPSSLTAQIARKLKQRGFFTFETLERERPKPGNKFTRYGSAPYKGQYRIKLKPRPKKK
jgi:hypothetical protein